MVNSNFSPLHTLLSGDHSSPVDVQRLLWLGTPINCKGINRVTPLHIAVQNDNCSLDVLRYLLDNGADVHARDFKARNPLLCLLRFSTDNERAKGTLLLLLDRGININARDRRGRSALHYALTSTFRKDFIELLLDHGANINRVCSTGCTPLHIAVNNRMVPMDTIKLLIDRGAYVCTSTKFSYLKPLHLAAKKRDPKIVKLLIDSGAYVNTFTKKGKESPLHFSACQNTTKTCRMLLDRGALVSCGTSPIRAVLSTHDVRENEVALRNAQLLLKYALLEDAVLQTDCTCNLLGRCSVSEELVGTWMKCLREIHEMQLVSVDPGGTNLAQFVFHWKFQMKRRTEDEIKSVSDKLLHLLQPNSYPSYSEVICGLISRKYLLDRLEDQVVSSNHADPCSGVRKSVVLNNYVLRILAEYLSKVDLLHLLLAFYNSHD